MKRDWKELPRGDVAPAMAGFHVTLNRKGWIGFNRTTHKRMGEPRAVLILFDRVNQHIGLRAANPGLRNAYPVVRYGQYGGRIVRAYRLLAEHDIQVPDTIEFTDPRIDEDGVLVLDLRTARVSNRYLAMQKFAERAETRA